MTLVRRGDPRISLDNHKSSHNKRSLQASNQSCLTEYHSLCCYRFYDQVGIKLLIHSNFRRIFSLFIVKYPTGHDVCVCCVFALDSTNKTRNINNELPFFIHVCMHVHVCIYQDTCSLLLTVLRR